MTYTGCWYTFYRIMKLEHDTFMTLIPENISQINEDINSKKKERDDKGVLWC